jgi:hypothetical protein
MIKDFVPLSSVHSLVSQLYFFDELCSLKLLQLVDWRQSVSFSMDVEVSIKFASTNYGLLVGGRCILVLIRALLTELIIMAETCSFTAE